MKIIGQGMDINKIFFDFVSFEEIKNSEKMCQEFIQKLIEQFPDVITLKSPDKKSLFLQMTKPLAVHYFFYMNSLESEWTSYLYNNTCEKVNDLAENEIKGMDRGEFVSLMGENASRFTEEQFSKFTEIDLFVAYHISTTICQKSNDVKLMLDEMYQN